MLIQDAVKALNELIDTANTLNDLIQLSENRRISLSGAADMATRSELRVTFRKQSMIYAAATAELQGLVISIGGVPKTRGTLVGLVQRNWLKARASLGPSDDIILRDMEEAEHRAAAQFGKMLPSGLPPKIQNTVTMRHQEAIRNYSAMHSRFQSRPGAPDAVMI